MTKSPTRRPRLWVPTVPGSLKFQVPETPNGCLRRPRFVALSDVRASQKVHTLLRVPQEIQVLSSRNSQRLFTKRPRFVALSDVSASQKVHTLESSTRNSSSTVPETQLLSTTSTLCGSL